MQEPASVESCQQISGVGDVAASSPSQAQFVTRLVHLLIYSNFSVFPYSPKGCQQAGSSGANYDSHFQTLLMDSKPNYLP
jgi:hypothetical protein